MKKVSIFFLIFFVFVSSIFSGELEKAVGVDFSLSGLSPNFYMVGNHIELETGLSFIQNDIFSQKNTIIPSVHFGYHTHFGKLDARIAIGLADSFRFGFTENSFNTGNLFSIYLRIAQPLDNRLEIGGLMYIPLHYVNISTVPDEYRNLLPSAELLAYGYTLFTFEIRYYLGGLWKSF